MHPLAHLLQARGPQAPPPLAFLAPERERVGFLKQVSSFLAWLTSPAAASTAVTSRNPEGGAGDCVPDDGRSPPRRPPHLPSLLEPLVFLFGRKNTRAKSLFHSCVMNFQENN